MGLPDRGAGDQGTKQVGLRDRGREAELDQGSAVNTQLSRTEGRGSRKAAPSFLLFREPHGHCGSGDSLIRFFDEKKEFRVNEQEQAIEPDAELDLRGVICPYNFV